MNLHIKQRTLERIRMPHVTVGMSGTCVPPQRLAAPDHEAQAVVTAIQGVLDRSTSLQDIRDLQETVYVRLNAEIEAETAARQARATLRWPPSAFAKAPPWALMAAHTGFGVALCLSAIWLFVQLLTLLSTR